MAAYTLADYQKGLKHAIGKPPDSQLITDVQFINGALKTLVYAHPWVWRQKTLTLTATSGANALSSLPSDFAGVYVLHAGSGLVGITGNSMLEEIVKLGAQQPQRSHSTYRYMISTTTQGSATARPTQVINIYPAAAANGTAEGIYLRTIPDLSGSTDVADLPLRYDELLMKLVRAKALIEDGQQADGQQEMAMYKDMLAAFITEDLANQSDSTGVAAK